MNHFYFGLPPAIVAIAIFIYMRHQQRKRNKKMRVRFWKIKERLMNNLHEKKLTKEQEDEN